MIYNLICFQFIWGEVTEWLKVPVLKTGVPKGTVGSNPTLSAILFCSAKGGTKKYDE